MQDLVLKDCDTFYGKAQALHGVTLTVPVGQITSIVGRNGAGKSTLLKTLMGLQPLSRGQRLMGGDDLSDRAPHQLNKLGLAYVPEDRQVFPNLTVMENLAVSTFSHPELKWNAARVLELFPRLGERRTALGGVLSGGEQQMLAIGRALLCNPRFLLLDEPTEGLAPIVVEQLVKAICRIRDAGVGVVLVEQNLSIPLSISDTIYALETGRVRWSGPAGQVRETPTLLDEFIGV